MAKFPKCRECRFIDYFSSEDKYWPPKQTVCRHNGRCSQKYKPKLRVHWTNTHVRLISSLNVVWALASVISVASINAVSAFWKSKSFCFHYLIFLYKLHRSLLRLVIE